LRSQPVCIGGPGCLGRKPLSQIGTALFRWEGGEKICVMCPRAGQAARAAGSERGSSRDGLTSRKSPIGNVISRRTASWPVARARGGQRTRVFTRYFADRKSPLGNVISRRTASGGSATRAHPPDAAARCGSSGDGVTDRGFSVNQTLYEEARRGPLYGFS